MKNNVSPLTFPVSRIISVVSARPNLIKIAPIIGMVEEFMKIDSRVNLELSNFYFVCDYESFD